MISSIKNVGKNAWKNFKKINEFYKSNMLTVNFDTLTNVFGI